MGRIFYGKNPPRSFCEGMRFDETHPYYIRIKSFQNDDVAPPHYSDDTLEFMLCRGLEGSVTVEEKKYEMRPAESRAIIIPPGVVHSNYLKRCDGSMYLLHISLKHSGKYIGIENLLSFESLKIDHLLYARPRYDEIMPSILRMIENDSNIFMCIRELLSIIEKICAGIPRAWKEKTLCHDDAGTSKLRNLIKWTSDRYTKRINIAEAAEAIGFSATYFCGWFKKTTGMTYVQYLNQVRIMQACRYLSTKMALKDAAYSCGFENISYFIQLFKKIQGCTPKNYIRNLTVNDRIY